MKLLNATFEQSKRLLAYKNRSLSDRGTTTIWVSLLSGVFFCIVSDLIYYNWLINSSSDDFGMNLLSNIGQLIILIIEIILAVWFLIHDKSRLYYRSYNMSCLAFVFEIGQAFLIILAVGRLLCCTQPNVYIASICVMVVN